MAVIYVSTNPGTSTTTTGLGANDSAFPKGMSESGGLTARQYFAGRAMAGLLAGSPLIDGSMGDRHTKVAKAAVAMADALLKELNK